MHRCFCKSHIVLFSVGPSKWYLCFWQSAMSRHGCVRGELTFNFHSHCRQARFSLPTGSSKLEAESRDNFIMYLSELQVDGPLLVTAAHIASGPCKSPADKLERGPHGHAFAHPRAELNSLRQQLAAAKARGIEALDRP